MSDIKFTDENKKKCDILKEAGIIVNNYSYNNRIIYTVTIKDLSNVDDFIENIVLMKY
jgi:hypothetical protein